MSYRVKRKCRWCGFVKEPFATQYVDESASRFDLRKYGPQACVKKNAGHQWLVLHDVEEDAPEQCQCGGHFIDQTDDGDGYLTCDCCGVELEYA